MNKTPVSILIFSFAIIATVIALNPEDPFSEGYDSTCPISYEKACETAEQTSKGVQDFSMAALGAQLGYSGGFTAGFACGLCESVFFGNTTQVNGTGTQCGNHGGDREAECCKNNGPQCGDNSFQAGYNVGYLNGCGTGYRIGKGEFAQGSLVTLGSYTAGFVCGTEGIINCSGGNLGGGNAENIQGLVSVL